jgi:hypothetical protein
MMAAFPLFLHYFSATQKLGSPKNYQQLVRHFVCDDRPASMSCMAISPCLHASPRRGKCRVRDAFTRTRLSDIVPRVSSSSVGVPVRILVVLVKDLAGSLEDFGVGGPGPTQKLDRR